MNQTQFLWLFFSFSGRLNRTAYALSGLLMYLFRLFPVYQIINAPDEATATYWGTVFVIMAVVSLVVQIPLAAKRLQDFGKPGGFGAFFIIADILMFIPLCLIPGTPGPNKYGLHTNAPKS